MVTDISDIRIVINADDDSLVGAEGWGVYSASASTQRFVELVRERVAQMFPDVEVEVDADVSIHSTRVEIGSDGDASDDEQAIRDVISDIWQSWTWLVS